MLNSEQRQMRYCHVCESYPEIVQPVTQLCLISVMGHAHCFIKLLRKSHKSNALEAMPNRNAKQSDFMNQRKQTTQTMHILLLTVVLTLPCLANLTICHIV